MRAGRCRGNICRSTKLLFDYRIGNTNVKESNLSELWQEIRRDLISFPFALQYYSTNLISTKDEYTWLHLSSGKKKILNKIQHAFPNKRRPKEIQNRHIYHLNLAWFAKSQEMELICNMHYLLHTKSKKESPIIARILCLDSSRSTERLQSTFLSL